MEIPEGVRVCCASDLLDFDESKALNFRKFYSVYKDQFPMLIVIIGGHYGETKYDCYDNLQVLRIHCATSQPRVVVDDSRRNPAARKGYVTIPEDTRMEFRVVKGHTKVGNPQKLPDILSERTELPLLLQFACDLNHPIRVGNSRHVARHFDSIFVRERFMEHFFIMNCVEGLEMKMTKLTCMACLSEDLEAAPVTGFKYKSKAEFDEFCRKLAKEVAESGVKYDMTAGNDDFSEYYVDDMRELIELSEFTTGSFDDFADNDNEAEDDDDLYEEMPPLPPPRDLPKKTTPTHSGQTKTSNTKHKAESKPVTQSKPNSPKVHKSIAEKEKETKVFFPFHLKKKHREEHDVAQAITKPGQKETVPQNVHVNKTITTKSASPHDALKVPPRITLKPQAKLVDPAKQVQGIEHDTHSGQSNSGQYVRLIGHSGYQNTKIGRATVKPFRRAPDIQEDQNDDVKKPLVETEEEQDEYETLDQVSAIREPAEPLINTNKDGKARNKVQERKIANVQNHPGEYYEDMDDSQRNRVEEEYLIPDTTTSKSTSVLNKDAISKDKGNRYNSKKQQKIEEKKPVVQEDENTKVAAEIRAKTLSIKEVGGKLTELKLGKYVDIFEENQIDGEILASLSVEDIVNELGLKKIEAIRLYKFACSGHIPR